MFWMLLGVERRKLYDRKRKEKKERKERKEKKRKEKKRNIVRHIAPPILVPRHPLLNDQANVVFVIFPFLSIRNLRKYFPSIKNRATA